jgi:MFS family permease
MLGTWIQQVAMHWLIYRLTDSVSLLGLTAFAAMAPQLVIGPLAGALIDRHDLRRLLIIVQGLLFLQAASLAGLTASGLIGPNLIIFMAAFLGVLSAFDVPLRQALVGRLMQDDQDLPSALAINGMILNAARLVGPPLAGWLIGISSEAGCFSINALTFLILMLAVTRMDLTPCRPATAAVRHLLVEGLRHAVRDYAVRTLLIAMALLNLTVSASLVLLPALARDRLGGDAETAGYLWGAAGLGAFLAMIDLAWRSSLSRVLSAAVTGTQLCAGGLLLLGLTSRPELALAALVLIGYGVAVANTGIGTLAQSITRDALRGRVISLLVAARFGFDAVGTLMVGLLAATFGMAATLAGLAVATGLSAAWLMAQRRGLREAAASRVEA